jgi:hypothetical protein
MGCDIHTYLEQLRPAGFDGNLKEWVSIDIWKYHTEDKTLSVRYEDLFYSGRNYTLFSFLANVRNGFEDLYGSGRQITPICMPRGLPKDVSGIVKQSADYWGPDAHSHSWLTADELHGADWNQKYKARGYVPIKLVESVKAGVPPQSWCYDYFPKDGSHEFMEWEDTVKNSCRDFIQAMYTKLDFDLIYDYRLVFWFDN